MNIEPSPICIQQIAEQAATIIASDYRTCLYVRAYDLGLGDPEELRSSYEDFVKYVVTKVIESNLNNQPIQEEQI